MDIEKAREIILIAGQLRNEIEETHGYISDTADDKIFDIELIIGREIAAEMHYTDIKRVSAEMALEVIKTIRKEK